MRLAPLALALLACGGPHAPEGPDPRALLGGETTVFDTSRDAFKYAARNLKNDLRGTFQLGDAIFNRNWVAAPATPQGNDGLGPTFNALSCSGCHLGNGRGTAPQEGEEPVALLLRLSVDGKDAHGGPVPEPRYGMQLESRAILGVPAEGSVKVTYVEEPGAFGDGEPYSLRRPIISIEGAAFGPMDPQVHVSPRLARQLIGLGLLQAVDEQTIRGFAASSQGHPNEVWDGQKMTLGRFGWKATEATVERQTMLAFVQDMGITSSIFPDENCPAEQTGCAQAPLSNTVPNLTAVKADAMVVHGMATAVPARRDLDDPVVQQGEKVFASIGCSHCHIPEMKTGTLEGWPELSNQTIHPYTDLLLHDLGENLADGRPEWSASGSEWRTPPLWGIGLVGSVAGELSLLNDGRARSFPEAILWHGGEAQGPREQFRALSKQDRDALVRFLETL